MASEASATPQKPDRALAYEHAQRLIAAGASRDAARPLQDAVALNPRLGVAWRALGDLRLIGGDAQGAQAAYDRMLAAVLPDERLRGPADALAERRIAEAEAALRRFLSADASSLPAAHLMAEVLARRGELAAAEALLAHCLERAPGMRLARLTMALLLHRQGRWEAALAQLERLLAEDARNDRGRMTKAAVLADLGDFAGAAEVTASLLADFPDQPHAWLVHANSLRTLGRIEDAVAAYRRVLALDPGSAEAFWSLANLKAFRFTPDDRSEMEALLSGRAAAPRDASLLHFALAKAEEDEGRDGEAIAHYDLANALQRGLRGYDPDATTAQMRRARKLYTPAFFAERAGWGDPRPDPIFIVGLPRSGSTLVEQILASHPQVEATRELMDVQAMADWVAAQAPGSPYPIPLASLPREAFAQLGDDYLERTRPLRRLGRARFIDKAPWNFQHLGLIRLMLPNARIVDVRRHPLGACVSAFRQHFAGGHHFAYDLGDLGRYYADYAQLMAHYDEVLPGYVIRVAYEALVEDTEGEVRRLLSALGLPFDPACLRFFDNPRAVATPSSEQVRRPIFADGVDGWRRYEPWLGPLKAALGPVLDAYASPP
jgi:tetratricopeptide (TPR) repeat protein